MLAATLLCGGVWATPEPAGGWRPAALVGALRGGALTSPALPLLAPAPAPLAAAQDGQPESGPDPAAAPTASSPVVPAEPQAPQQPALPAPAEPAPASDADGQPEAGGVPPAPALPAATPPSVQPAETPTGAQPAVSPAPEPGESTGSPLPPISPSALPPASTPQTGSPSPAQAGSPSPNAPAAGPPASGEPVPPPEPENVPGQTAPSERRAGSSAPGTLTLPSMPVAPPTPATPSGAGPGLAPEPTSGVAPAARPVKEKLAVRPGRPPVMLLRSEATFRQLGWRSRWEWQGAKATLERLGLQVVIVKEDELAEADLGAGVLVLANARNLSSDTLAAIRAHLARGGKLLASYQTSYRQPDNTSWKPNGLALGPELGVKFLRWNGTPGETEAMQAAAPYGHVGLARHQGMLVEALPEASVLANWESRDGSELPAIVQNGSAIYMGEDLLAPENSHSRQVCGLLAGLLNRLDNRLKLPLPKTATPLLEPQPPFTALPAEPGETLVRVGLGTLNSPGGQLHLGARKAVLDSKGKSLGKQVELVAKSDGLHLVAGNKSLASGARLTVSGSPYLSCWQENSDGTLHWSAYRGSLQLIAGAHGSVQAINLLPGDQYLAGVIPSEVPFTFPTEALRAMAVVARTFSLSHLKRHSGEGFDVCSEVHCQVFRGLGQEHPNTTGAIVHTRGEILRSGEAVADTTFHACCGGHGVDVQDTWLQAAPVSYLTGSFDQLPSSPVADLTREEPFRRWLDARHPSYCSSAGRFRWEERFAWSELERKLQQSIPVLLPGSTLTSLRSLEVTRRDRSGRVLELKIGALPADLRLGGDRVRWLTSGGSVGAGGLQSSLFYLETTGSGADRSLRISGGGWGHGVGLCQEGAAGRARAGQNYRQILAHYYPGATLTLPEEPPVPQRVRP